MIIAVDWSTLTTIFLAEFVLGFAAGYLIRGYKPSGPPVQYPLVPAIVVAPPGTAYSIPLVPGQGSGPESQAREHVAPAIAHGLINGR